MRSGDWTRTIWGWVVWRRAACCSQLLIQGHLFKVQCVIHICQSTCFSSNSVSEGGSLGELWRYSMPKLLNTFIYIYIYNYKEYLALYQHFLFYFIFYCLKTQIQMPMFSCYSRNPTPNPLADCGTVDLFTKLKIPYTYVMEFGLHLILTTNCLLSSSISKTAGFTNFQMLSLSLVSCHVTRLLAFAVLRLSLLQLLQISALPGKVKQTALLY